MKKILFVILVLSLCSCSDEHKANRFIKFLGSQCEFVFKEINETSASVYYKKNEEYYKYDVRTEEHKLLFQLTKDDTFLLDNYNSNLGKGYVFYLKNPKGIVYCHDIISGKDIPVNNKNGKTLKFLGKWYSTLLFADESNYHKCDSFIIHYNANNQDSYFVTFDECSDFPNDCKKYFQASAVTGHNGIFIILEPNDRIGHPLMTEEEYAMYGGNEPNGDLRHYLFHYNFKNPDVSMDLLSSCFSQILVRKSNSKTTILTYDEQGSKTGSKTVIYNLNGEIEKKFPSIDAWPKQRGLTSGNIIAESDKDRILCYIANDDDKLISSIRFYYYDGYTGEESEINFFENADGEKIEFVMHTEERKYIYKTSNNEGLIFYGETDWGNEYALFYFDFASRKTMVVDRGKNISFTRNRFKIEQHNGSVVWYDTNGLRSNPEEKSYFYKMGQQVGKQFKQLEEFLNLFE